MAQAYVPIQTVTVGSGGAASIDFINIPQSYTDLYVVLSGRTARSAATDSIYIKFNNNASNYSFRDIDVLGATIESGSYSDYPAARITADTATASTFGTWSAYVPNYTGSNNKSVSLEGVSPNNSGTQYIRISAGLWSNSAAITRITLISQNAQNFLQHSTATLYGIGGARASGGTITADARYTYHTFTSTGTFTALEKIKGAEVLLVAGGGGGGGNRSGGGGGAGGLLFANGQLLTSGNSYTVAVGAGGGGAGALTSQGTNGSNSSFGSNIAIGGGGAGSGDDAGGTNTGKDGGSGGGGGGWDGAGANAGGIGTVGQGNNGSSSAAAPNYPSGGGGGAGAAGQTVIGSATSSANGGVGSTTYSSWGYATSTGALSGGVYYYAGGGGGGGNPNATGGGTGGLGGGGNGGANTANGTAGTANTGGGGGGSGLFTTGVGQSGGSGLVIIRYPN